jgi:hypothetical protein
MKILQEKEVIRVEDFNTCNGWGFGGGVGKEFTYKSGSTVRAGKAYYRHLPPTSFFAIRNKDGEVVYDEYSAPTIKDKRWEMCNRVLTEGV